MRKSSGRWRAIYKKNKVLSPAMKQFLNILKEGGQQSLKHESPPGGAISGGATEAAPAVGRAAAAGLRNAAERRATGAAVVRPQRSATCANPLRPCRVCFSFRRTNWCARRRGLTRWVSRLFCFSGFPTGRMRALPALMRAMALCNRRCACLKKELPDLLVITDVCLCEYMSHGHCGIVQTGPRGAKFLNDPDVEVARAHRRQSCRSRGGHGCSQRHDGWTRARHSRRNWIAPGLRTRQSCRTRRSLRRLITARSAKRRNPRPNLATGAVTRWMRRTRTKRMREVALDIQEGADIVHGETGAGLSGYYPSGKDGVRLSDGGLRGERGVFDGESGGGKRLD